MKKNLCFIMIVLLILTGFAGCSGQNDPTENVSNLSGSESDQPDNDNDQAAAGIETNKGANQKPDSQSSKNIGDALYLSALKNGDKVWDGFTIEKIKFVKGYDSADFTLKGEMVLTGNLYYDGDMYDSFLFAADMSIFNKPIIIEHSSGSLSYETNALYFRNEDALVNAISSNEIKQVKNGSSLFCKIMVKDLENMIRIGSEGGTTCEFVTYIEGFLNTDGDNSTSDNDSTTANSNSSSNTNLYDTNLNYDFDLNNDGTIETFNVVASYEDIYLTANNKRYEINGMLPELVYYKFGFTTNNDSGNYVFVFEEANPPNGPAIIHFYEYAPNYSMERLGSISPGLELAELDIQYLNYSEVKTGGQTYSIEF